MVVAVRPAAATTTHRRRERSAAVANTARRRQGKRGAQPPMGRYRRQGGIGTVVVVGRRGRCRRYHNFRSFQQQAAVVAVGWGGGKGGLRAEVSKKGAFTGKKKERLSVKHGPNNYKTPNHKCRLYWCLLELIDRRYCQSCWYCRPLL